MHYLEKHKLTHATVADVLSCQIPAELLKVPTEDLTNGGYMIADVKSYKVVNKKENKVRFFISDGSVALMPDDMVFIAATPSYLDCLFASNQITEALEGVSITTIGQEAYEAMVVALTMLSERMQLEKLVVSGEVVSNDV